MQAIWSDDELVLSIQKSDLAPVGSDIVDAIFTLALADEAQGELIGKFLTLGLIILFKGVLQFVE